MSRTKGWNDPWNDHVGRSGNDRRGTIDTKSAANPRQCSRSTGTATRNETHHRIPKRSTPPLGVERWNDGRDFGAATALLDRLRACGFRVRAKDGRLLIAPGGRLPGIRRGRHPRGGQKVITNSYQNRPPDSRLQNREFGSKTPQRVSMTPETNIALIHLAGRLRHLAANRWARRRAVERALHRAGLSRRVALRIGRLVP
jgi:hypothetical protein